MLALLVALALAADAPKTEVDLVPKISGYAQVQASAGIDNTGDGVAPTASLSLRRVRVRLKGNLLQGAGYTFMVDLATLGNFTRDAFLWTTLIPHHELRLGQQKTQFGYENPESASNLYIVNRAFVSDALARGPDLRDLGIGLLGQWDLPAGFGIDYQLTAVDGAGPNVLADDTPRKNVWARAGASFKSGAWTAKLGVSGANGDRLFKADPTTGTPAFKSRFTRAGLDARVDAPWFFAVVEGVVGTNDGNGVRAGTAGYYALAAGKTPWNLGPVFRAEAYDPNLSAVADIVRRYTIGAYADLRLPEMKSAWIRLLANLELDGSEVKRDHALVGWVQVVY